MQRLYVFTSTATKRDGPRQKKFAPAIGNNEDPVTGTAKGPSEAYLIHYGWLSINGSCCFQAMQG
jgi:predicted PhzF superfamily epimerase YddE/YHI9